MKFFLPVSNSTPKSVTILQNVNSSSGLVPCEAPALLVFDWKLRGGSAFILTSPARDRWLQTQRKWLFCKCSRCHEPVSARQLKCRFFLQFLTWVQLSGAADYTAISRRCPQNLPLAARFQCGFWNIRLGHWNFWNRLLGTLLTVATCLSISDEFDFNLQSFHYSNIPFSEDNRKGHTCHQQQSPYGPTQFLHSWHNW